MHFVGKPYQSLYPEQHEIDVYGDCRLGVDNSPRVSVIASEQIHNQLLFRCQPTPAVLLHSCENMGVETSHLHTQ